jgi:ribokinase
MVCRVGSDSAGKELLDNFEKNGVYTKYIINDPHSSSGTAFVTVDSRGENSIVIYPGANMKLSVADLDSADGEIRKAGLVVSQLEIPVATVKRTADLSKLYKVPFILNPAPAPSEDISSILRNVDVLCPNKTEAEALTGQKILNVDDAKKAGAELLKFGVKNVVITLGSSGALYVSENTEQLYSTPPVTVRDTTGAGDAFVGSFAFSLCSGSSIPEAVKFANVAAALSITRDGTQAGLPTREEVKGLCESYY